MPRSWWLFSISACHISWPKETADLPLLKQEGWEWGAILELSTEVSDFNYSLNSHICFPLSWSHFYLQIKNKQKGGTLNGRGRNPYAVQAESLAQMFSLVINMLAWLEQSPTETYLQRTKCAWRLFIDARLWLWCVCSSCFKKMCSLGIQRNGGYKLRYILGSV